jgi:beta-N-acetylhexosaminidase
MSSIPTVFVSLENPYHLLDAPRVRTFINTYGSSEIILDSLVEKLMGRSAFVGESPVDAFCGMWDTRL